MAVKNMSTRLNICGRSEKCRGGHSAVEQSAYISRRTMYCEYDGQTYYPKYSEDLVHSEVMLPVNAPEKYKDASVLWNEVELFEKGDSAQLARTFRVVLPNEWSYELATEVMGDYIKRNFVDKGMCVQFAIHDSENKKTGQRNLHCHMMFTLRSIDDKGHWMAKQRKEYLKDENGERIPLIDKKTGQQKVDKQNRKQWKCKSIPTNDWSSKENAKLWRKDLADTINAVNERTGISENHWEHRSFKEQGLDILPQIHMGEKASALERAGVATERGDINRDIIRHNTLLMQAKAVLEQAIESIERMKAAQPIVTIVNEVVELINRIIQKKGRLDLPIVSGKYLRKFPDRGTLQSKEDATAFIVQNGIDSFEALGQFQVNQERLFTALDSERKEQIKELEHLASLSELYSEYKPLLEIKKQSDRMSGLSKRYFDREHAVELSRCRELNRLLKYRLGAGEKVVPHEWSERIAELKEKLGKSQKAYGQAVSDLAHAEVISFNKDNYEREQRNEQNRGNKQKGKEQVIG